MLAAFNGVDGGPEFSKAVEVFLSKWGFRCPGEIDACTPRWSDNPLSLLQFVAGNLSSGEIGDHQKHFQHVRQQAEQLIRTMQLEVRQCSRFPGIGAVKSFIIGRLCRVTRSAAGLREHPKAYIIRSLNMSRQIILKEAEKLVETGLLQTLEDAHYLFVDEIAFLLERPNIYSQQAIAQLIAQRKADLERFEKMQPSRVFTTYGERVESSHSNSHLPQGALAGVPVSSGVVEGIARVVLDPHTTVLEKGEVLIAPFTDPGWTPLFINAVGLAMEVGGLMTHGSVVAREYGIPAVVSVPNITKLVKTGQRVRIDGTSGYVQILEERTEGQDS